jgi:uncharacterized protein YegJ (DUF2314 family)
MKRLLLAVMFFVPLVSCERLPGWIQSRIPRRTGTAAEQPAPTLHLNQADEELRLIALNAKDTLPIFFRHMLRPAKNESGFCIKYPFRTDSGSGFSMEQLWLSEISFKDGVYYGVLVNNPFYISSMKKGDTVIFSADEITDWMYAKNGKIIGGRSIKYLLEQIPASERGEEQRQRLQMFE